MRSLLIEKAITIIAQKGLSGLTHRSLAEKAGCSLATASYHFPKKSSLVEAVAKTVISGYLDDLELAAQNYKERKDRPKDMMEFSSRVLRATIGHQRDRTAAWAEIYIDGIRETDSREIVRGWIEQLHKGWMNIAKVVEPAISKSRLVSTLDLNIGSIFIVLALDLSPTQVDAVLNQGKKLPYNCLHDLPEKNSKSKEATKIESEKAQRTRDIILSACYQHDC